MKGTIVIAVLLMGLAIVAACAGSRDIAAPYHGGLLAVGSCSYDTPQWTPNPPTGEGQEEIYGNITTNNQSTNWTASLLTRDTPSHNNQTSYFSGLEPVNFGASCKTGGPGHYNSGNPWGWYGLGFDPQCADNQVQTSNDAERHRVYNGTFPQTYEAHCVRAGLFDVVLSDQSNETGILYRPVDFVAYSRTGLYPGPVGVSVGQPEIPGTSGDATADVVVYFDQVHTGSPATPVIEITAVVNRADTTWFPLQLNAGAYHAPSNFWLRFSAGKSTGFASGVNTDLALVRYFWNWGVSTTDVTGFTNVTYGGSSSLVRVKQLPAGTRTVRAHLVQPFEWPPAATSNDTTSTSYGAVLDLPLSIYGSLTASISPASGSASAGTPIQLTDVGSNGAGTNTYTWRFGDGTGGTGAPVNHTYAAAGTYYDTLTKTDLYGYSVVSTGQVTVTVQGPVGPPTNLAVGTVTSTSAVLTWTTGDPLATTTVQDRINGAGTWTTFGSVAAGVARDSVTGLSSCTSYDANVYHVRNGINSAQATLLNGVRTPAASGACAPTSFQVTGCTEYSQAGKTYMNPSVAWIRHEYSSGSTTEIGQAGTNNSGSASIILSVPSSTVTAIVGPYLEQGNYNEYLWVRHKTSGGGTSAWVALASNPIHPLSGCGA